GKGSEQERWLRADLAAHDNQCTLAYWHQARFVSDKEHGNHAESGPFWEALYDYGAELILSGHAHVYERFGPQTPSAKADPDQAVSRRRQAVKAAARSARPTSSSRVVWSSMYSR